MADQAKRYMGRAVAIVAAGTRVQGRGETEARSVEDGRPAMTAETFHCTARDWESLERLISFSRPYLWPGATEPAP